MHLRKCKRIKENAYVYIYIYIYIYRERESIYRNDFYVPEIYRKISCAYLL